MQCGCCGTWQHYHCYGFVLQKPRLDQHFCYKCLLEEWDIPRLDELAELAAFRRAVWILYDRKPSSEKKFQEQYGEYVWKDKLASTVKRLKREGFLRPKGKSWPPVVTSKQKELWHYCYLDPMTLIGIFVSQLRPVA